MAVSSPTEKSDSTGSGLETGSPRTHIGGRFVAMFDTRGLDNTLAKAGGRDSHRTSSFGLLDNNAPGV